MTITTDAADTAVVSLEESAAGRPRASKAKAAPAGIDPALVAQLVTQAREQGVRLSGEGGLLQQLTKVVLESALEGEITGRPRECRPSGQRPEGRFRQVVLRRRHHRSGWAASAGETAWVRDQEGGTGGADGVSRQARGRHVRRAVPADRSGVHRDALAPGSGR